MFYEPEYKIVFNLREPVGGYWDGGKKSRFEFTIESINEDKDGFYAKVGSWEANCWRCVGAGKKKQLSERAILSIARNVFLRKLESNDIIGAEAIIEKI